MTEFDIDLFIKRAQAQKRTGNHREALRILQQLEDSCSVEETDNNLLGQIYKAQAKVLFIQNKDQECLGKCLQAAMAFALAENQQEAFNIAGIIGGLHPDFAHLRYSYARSLQGVGQFMDRDSAFRMCQTGLQILQTYFPE